MLNFERLDHKLTFEPMIRLTPERLLVGLASNDAARLCYRDTHDAIHAAVIAGESDCCSCSAAVVVPLRL